MISSATLEELGFDPTQLEVRETLGTGGAVRMYVVDLVLEVCNARFPARVVAPDLGTADYNLLGRDPLFRYVHFAFEEYEDPRRNRVLWKLP